MSTQTIQTLKGYFKTGAKPTEAQFANLIDSYFHKTDKIPADSIEGVSALIAEAVLDALDDDTGRLNVDYNKTEFSWNDNKTELTITTTKGDEKIDEATVPIAAITIDDDSITVKVGDTEATIPTNGGGGTASDTSYSNDGTSTVAVGGLAKGTDLSKFTDVQSLLDAILTPYVAISALKVTTNLGGTYEKGVAQTLTTVTPSWTAGSKAVSAFSVDIEPAGYSGKNTTGDSLTGLGLTVKTTQTISATLSDGTTTIKATGAVTFVDPYFYGSLSASSQPSSSSVLNLTKSISVKGQKTFTFKPQSQYPCIAYPASYGTLKSILDSNGYEYLSDFTRYTVNVNASSGLTAYYVYVDQTAVTSSSFSFTFKPS